MSAGPTGLPLRIESTRDIAYPSGTSAVVAGFTGGETLNVYSGETAVGATFLQETFPQQSGIEGTITAQACNQEICLQPSEFRVSIEVSAHGSVGRSRNAR